MTEKNSSESWYELALKDLNAKAKPPGSLGNLEQWAARLCALQQTLEPVGKPVGTLIFAADHGITKSSQVSAYPRSVTVAVFKSIAKGRAASSTLSASFGLTLLLMDVGIDADVSDTASGTENVIVQHRKVSFGTRDFTCCAAMTEEELSAAVSAGRSAVQQLHEKGIVGICLGELGIGNTTSAAALLSALTGRPASEVTGSGSGLGTDGVARKAAVVEAALRRCNAPQCGAKRLLQEVGGLEIAAMVGAVLEASERRMAVLVDGFISGAAALVASRLDGSVAGALFCSHRSAEPGGGPLLECLGQPLPPIDLKMRLGEATGAILAAPMLAAAAAIMGMATLEEALE